MKTYNYKWETHHKKAGATGQLQADSEDEAIEKLRQQLSETTNFTQDVLDQLVIEIKEVS